MADCRLYVEYEQDFGGPMQKGWAKENINPGPGGVGALKPDRQSAPEF
jgi:hypothetical protein